MKSAYEAAPFWNGFKEIVEMSPKCATPTITFTGGRLHFDCATEGVTYHSSVSAMFTGDDITVSSSFTVVVKVYASKEGYSDSDPFMKELDIAGMKGDVNGDGLITAQEASLILQLVAGKIKGF